MEGGRSVVGGCVGTRWQMEEEEEKSSGVVWCGVVCLFVLFGARWKVDRVGMCSARGRRVMVLVLGKGEASGM